MTVKLLKTRNGYLHKEIQDGYATERGGVNYRFTWNPELALVFTGPHFIPTGLGVPTETELDIAQDCADYLNGWFVEPHSDHVDRRHDARPRVYERLPN